MKKIKKYLLLLLCLFIAALNFNLILKPLKLVAGGTQGLAIIFNHIFNIKPSIVILIINITMLIISYFKLPKDTTKGTILATFAYPIFVRLTSFFEPINISIPIIAVGLAGIVCGLTGGFIYKLGFSSGGINVVALVVRKFYGIRLGKTNFIVNTIIILLGCFYFGMLKALYSILVIFINSYLINKIVGYKR